MRCAECILHTTYDTEYQLKEWYFTQDKAIRKKFNDVAKHGVGLPWR